MNEWGPTLPITGFQSENACCRNSDIFPICGGDPNFSTLEVESPEDLCLTPQTGAVCSRSSTEEGPSGEEAVRQRAPPAVDVLGGNPQATQNVAGESPRHAPQPVAAAPRPVPPITNPSTVPLLDSIDSAVLVMENAPPTGLPETLTISSDAGVISEEISTQESVAAVIGVARCIPSPLPEDCGFYAEAQMLQAPLCQLTSDSQVDITVQELQYGLQTDEEKSHSNSQTNQVEPSTARVGPVAITGTEKKQAANLEYKSETETDSELGGKEHTMGKILTQSQSQLCFTASSPCPQSSVDVTTMEHGTSEQSDREPPAPQNPGCIYSSGAEEQMVDFQDSESSPHSLPSYECRGGEQNYVSTPNPQIINAIANSEKQSANTTEAVEMSKQIKEIVDLSDKAKQPASTEKLETPKDGESCPGLCLSPESSICYSTVEAESCNIQETCKPSDEEQVAISVSEEQTAASACDPAPTSPKTSSAHPLFNTGIMVSLQTEQVVEGESSHPSNQVSLTDTPLIAELVRSADNQEIVVVREGAHIGGDWTNLHLKQSYLVQREDGSVCEAAIVNELTSEHSSGGTKLYGESVQTAMELDAQPVEVYEFCSLVEEVAEETVCASGSVQIPHSPGYEVNLFNALLENSEEYTVKEELDTHLNPTIHTINESDTVIISQQPLPSSHAATQIEANDISSNLSIPNAVEQHLVLDTNTNEVCLVEVAADSFTVTQTDTRTQIVTTCAQVGAPASDRPGVSDSPVTVQINQQAKATAGLLTLISPVESGDGTSLASSVTVSVHSSHIENQTPEVTVVSATKPGACVSSQEGTKETPAPSETRSQTVAVTAGTKPEAPITAPGIINPKLLLLQPAKTTLPNPPQTVLAQVSQQPNVAGTLANTHSSASKECLGHSVGATDSLCTPVALRSQKSQTQGQLSKASSTVPPIKVQQTNIGGNITLKLYQTEPVTPTTPASDEALIVTTASTCDAIPQGEGPLAGTPTLNMLTVPAESTVTSSPSPNDPSDSPYMDEDGEEMEHDETQEATLGQVSSPEEGSDEEPDADKMESEMSTPSSPHKVRQWIAGRGTLNPAPISPSSSSYPGRPSSSDWTTLRRERASPLRGPHGKFVSPSSVVGYASSSSPPDQSSSQRPRSERHTDMAELAKHEADIEHRTQALKREGFWSTKRLTRLTEPQRPKVHWDYLCEEMQWLSADFAQERRWKRGVARKVVRMVMRHHEELRQKEEKAKRDEHAKIRRVASSIAKEVRAFWSSVEKVVQYKQQSRLEEKRKKALDLQLDFIVGQTEKYSDLLSKSLAPARPSEPAPPPPKTSVPNPGDEDDRDFEPTCEEEDDEETIEVEEQQEGNDAESHRREIELLKEEGMLPLDQLLSTLKLPQDSGSDEESSDETSSSAEEEEEDGEFTANEEDAEDEEDTIAAQEKVEGNVDHAEELDDLAKEGDMSIEDLLEKYKGAYAADFEAPSASGSKESSDSEVSGEEEVETEEDESDVESNTSSSDSAGDSGEEDDSEKEEEESEGDENEDNCADEGTEVLLKEGDNSPPSSSGSRPKKEISHIAATAESLQPKGYTLATTKVKTPIPFLLHGTLREYQHIGLDWLVTMFEKKLNGILADEMGLGKTIQTIALLAHLACEKGNWGPHLIIVPTSVMLNWEMELKRWCPGFKILTYFGSQKERKLKRQGWTKPNAFHVCITSYKLVLQDHQAFRRKSWRYLILDEAQNIKNFKSQRWQSLLNFNSHRRLLLTGTPLQNSLMELWSLMHFLMPHVFQSHREFKEWFSNPLTGMIEGSQEYNEGLVKRLHKVLRPFLLRRIKADVEKQMPKKYEHVVRCRLSKRQRFLYDDFMSQASTRETLASGHFMSVINILMQLRKVCNHPNLFDPRPIQSPFITQPIVFNTASLVQDALEVSPLKRCDLSMFNLVSLEGHVSRYEADVFLPQHKVGRQLIQEIMQSPEPPPRPKPVRMKVNRMFQPPPKTDNRPVILMNKPTCSVPPAAQTPKPTAIEVAPPPAPVVQQVVCSVGATPPPRASVHPAAQTAVRSSTPKPVLTVRPPAAPGTASIPAHPTPNTGSVMPQRVLLSPDMQARLPSGEVVSIAQLASLAGRPVSSCQGSKPVTFQLQGNKLTLSGAQIHQVPAAPPRPVQGNVMHLVSSGVQHLITHPAQVTVQTTGNTHVANPAAPAMSANRLPHGVSPQVPSSVVSSAGVVKIVVRQSAGKEGGPVPTLAVAPSPRIAPQASPTLHPHTNATPIRATATLQISQCTPGPATAHYTIAPPRTPSTALNQQQPPRPILKVVQPPAPIAEQPAPAPATSSFVTKSAQCDSSSSSSSSNQTSVSAKSRPCIATKPHPPPRRMPRPPPRSPFHMQWLANSHKQSCDSRMDLIARVNEHHCSLKPVYGSEILDFLTFLSGPRPTPAIVSSCGDWPRSGHSSCLLSQRQHKDDYWLQSRTVREAIHSIEERLKLLADIVDRFTFVIPPVEAPAISMHCCHPPPSLSHKQTVFSSMLTAQVAPLTRGLHRIQCNMRTQFPDLRLIQYDCGKLQTLHTLLRKLKTGGHRVLIFTQMTRMLDVLEQFLNYHGHIYLRLDGSTRVEQRQALMERFNADRRIFCFILSTRSGGVGVNLTGADTVVFYDSDWNPTMDAQAQDRCHRIGQTRDVHIYRLISERTVEENILKKANQKRMLGDMAIEGGNFTTAFFKQQTIRELFDVTDGEKRETAAELSMPHSEEEEAVNKQSTTILEQALCRAEDEEDIVAASQAKAEQVAELAEFNENIPLDDGGEQEEVEELSKAEQEIAALVEQLTPIERYAMNFLEASLEDVCKEELKQAEEQVEAARKGLDQAKEEGLKLHTSDDEDDDFLSPPASVEPTQQTPARRGRKPKDKDKVVTSTRTSGRLRGASPETEPEPTTLREVPEKPRFGLRGGRGAAREIGSASTTPSSTDQCKTPTTARQQDHSKSSKASSPARDHQKTRTPQSRPQPGPVPSPPTTSPPGGKQASEMESRNSKAGREEEGQTVNERRVSESLLESSCAVDHQTKGEDGKDQNAMSPPCTSSRSPRKRQSADGEVLRGLVDDSPSAKVLRKLPGRLVTVVEEKEPRRRRRRGSGTGGGGSSEEATMEESAGFSDEPNKDSTSPSPDNKTKGTVSKSLQDQDSTLSPSQQLLPVRGYPPYSPPHLSPDMPVLRNLPVRRRLETESRMAAQLGEQLHLGRGRGGNQPKKVDILPGKDPTSSLAESGVNSVGTPLKRKRGRPPKTPPRLSEPDNTMTIPSPPTSPTEEGNPPLSPKRKRGRPRKDSTTVPDTVGEGQNFKKETTTTDMSTVSNADANTELPERVSPIAAVVSVGLVSHSAGAEETDPELSTASPNSAQSLETRTDQACVPVSASIQSPPTTASQVASSPPAAIQVTSSAAETPAMQVSYAPLSMPATGPVSGSVTASPPLPLKQTTMISMTSEGPLEQNPPLSTTALDATKTSAVFPPAAISQSVVCPTIKAAPTVLAKATIPAVTTVVKAVTTPKASAVKDPLQTSALPPTTSTPVTVTSTSPDTQGCSSSTSPVTALLTPSSFPTTQPSQTTPAETVQRCPSHVAAVEMTPVKTAQARPSVSANVSLPVSGSPGTATPVAPAETTSSNLSSCVGIDISNAPKKPVSPTATTLKVAEQVTTFTSAEQSSVCTASRATTSCPSVTATKPVKTVTMPFPQEKINKTKSAAAAAPPKEHKPPSTTTTTEKTVKSPKLASTSILSELATLTTVTTTLSPCSSTATTAISTQLSFSTAAPVPTAATTCPQVTTSQTSSCISTEAKNSASEGISPEVTPQIEALPHGPTTACCGDLSEKPMKEPPMSDQVIDVEMDTVHEARPSKKGEKMPDAYESQPKRRKVECSPETKDHEIERKMAEREAKTAPQKDELTEETIEDQETPPLKRPLSRQSSQESTRSSSPSSGCSTSTLTRHAHHKRTYENRHPSKRMRVDVASELGKEDLKDQGEGRTEEGSDDLSTARRRSRSSSSSSDSDSGGGRKEHRLTRSGKRHIQDQEKQKGNNQQGKKAVLGSDRNTSNNANVSTGGESGSDTSSVRITRKSAGSQPSQDSKSETNSTPPLPPEPEVLGKRCSALNAAAKLLAMKGRVDTPGHTTRRESGVKAVVTSPITPSDKNQKPKSKSVPASPQSNSVSQNNNKSSCSKPSTPNQANRPASRSTRQCPGSLVPPLEGEYKRSKPEEKDRGNRKSSHTKEGEVQSSSRGHSACSSMSSDGEGEGGGHSSRSRSSSNSSQRTHSISSQNTEHRESRSRATSSGSERERDRSSERGKRDKTEKRGLQRESRRDGRRSQKLPQEVGGSTEGTPDRVLRSVAALAAVQARSPAASTRSSANQNRNKT